MARCTCLYPHCRTSTVVRLSTTSSRSAAHARTSSPAALASPSTCRSMCPSVRRHRPPPSRRRRSRSTCGGVRPQQVHRRYVLLAEQRCSVQLVALTCVPMQASRHLPCRRGRANRCPLAEVRRRPSPQSARPTHAPGNYLNALCHCRRCLPPRRPPHRLWLPL